MNIYSSQKRRKRNAFKPSNVTIISFAVGILFSFGFLFGLVQNRKQGLSNGFGLLLAESLPPLAMVGGDPHIRALMRTISASESNGKNSYALLYGGSHFHDFSQHPNECILIQTGPNRNKCSTAAGRYQFLTSTWREKASKYHPIAFKKYNTETYNFDPKYQDIVTYRWLKDHHEWDVDILKMLKDNRIKEVLVKLSGTWTSLGGGIENNMITPYLPNLYQKFLQEELKLSPKNLSINSNYENSIS